MSFFKGDNHAFEADDNPLSDTENEVFDKVARKVVDRGMGMPAILFLESVKPLNYIGSQVLVFFEPIVQAIFNFRDYETFRTALEKRESVEVLLLKIEKYDSVALSRERRIKRYMKEQKKSWTWYQRYLGLFRPKVRIPEEVLDPPVEPSHKQETGNDKESR